MGDKIHKTTLTDMKSETNKRTLGKMVSSLVIMQIALSPNLKLVALLALALVGYATAPPGQLLSVCTHIIRFASII